MSFLELLQNVLLPISLIIIMFGMGLTLELEDFSKVLKSPKAALVGFLNQLILLPIAGYLIVKLFNLPPAFAVGMMILAACPGGVTSNLISYLAKADLALSISLTAITSFVTVITIPLIVTFSLNEFYGEARTINLPVVKTVIQILVLTVIPVAIGMFIRKRFLSFAEKSKKAFRIASSIIFVSIVILMVLVTEDVWGMLLKLGASSLTLNLVTIVTALVTASLFGLTKPQRLTIAIESGIQNGTLGMLVAATILGVQEMAIPSAVYGLLMFASGALIILYGNKLKS